MKFEEFYTDSQVKIDEVAERILTLQGKPLHTFEDYVRLGGCTSLGVIQKKCGNDDVRGCTE